MKILYCEDDMIFREITIDFLHIGLGYDIEVTQFISVWKTTETF